MEIRVDNNNCNVHITVDAKEMKLFRKDEAAMNTFVKRINTAVHDAHSETIQNMVDTRFRIAYENEYRNMVDRVCNGQKPDKHPRLMKCVRFVGKVAKTTLLIGTSAVLGAALADVHAEYKQKQAKKTKKK